MANAGMGNVLRAPKMFHKGEVALLDAVARKAPQRAAGDDVIVKRMPRRGEGAKVAEPAQHVHGVVDLVGHWQRRPLKIMGLHDRYCSILP